MKQSSFFLLSCLLVASLSATAETFKCISKDGKVRYTNQMSYEKGVKCDAMFVRKQPVLPDAPVVESGSETIPQPELTEGSGPDTPKEVAQPPQKTQADKDLEAKRKKVEEEKKKADQAAEAKKVEEKKQAEQKTKEVKDRNCANAKTNLATFKAGRVRKMDDKGEYYFLDDAGVKLGLAQAEKDIAENCK